MSYLATVFNIMISAPSDADEECEIAREVIYAWNTDNAEPLGKILFPVDWKNNTVPEAGTPPQRSINRQIVEKADILVALLKHRLGTPTDNAISGTVEEIQEVLESKKPVLLYFSGEPVEQEDSEGEQWRELSNFKRTCQNKDYYKTFKNAVDLEKILPSHITQIAHTLSRLQQTPEPPPSTATNVPIADHFALELLMAAAQDENGTIYRYNYNGNFGVQSGQKYVNAKNSREEAQLNNAIEQLEQIGFIRPTDNKHNKFSITQKGYDFIDSQAK